MKPEKAFELVGNYARLTKALKSAKLAIGLHLGRCAGVSGKRQDLLGEMNDPRFALDEKGRELDLHINSWYTPDTGVYGDHRSWIDIDEEQKEECPHCYAAHMAIQDRKEVRAQLGHVKRAMTRSAS